MSKFKLLGDKNIEKIVPKKVQIIGKGINNTPLPVPVPMSNAVSTVSAYEIMEWIASAQSHHSRIFNMVKPAIDVDITGSTFSVISISQRSLSGRATLLMSAGHSMQKTMSMAQIERFIIDNDYPELPVAIQFGERLLFSIENRSWIRAEGLPGLIEGMLPFRNKMRLGLGRGNYINDFESGTLTFQPRTYL